MHAIHGTTEGAPKETKYLLVYLRVEEFYSVAKVLSGRVFVGWVRQTKIMLATSTSREQGGGLDTDRSRGIHI